jgi:hypothetical protein
MYIEVKVLQRTPTFEIDQMGTPHRLPVEEVTSYNVKASSLTDAVEKARNICGRAVRRLVECRIFQNGLPIGESFRSNSPTYA